MTESHLIPSYKSIPCRPLGHSNRIVSKIGLGMAAIGRPSYLTLGHAEDLRGRTSVQDLREWCHKILDHAWESGVRYFDAARSYGLSEQFLSEWIDKRKFPREECTLGSKWGYVYTGNWKQVAPHHELKYHNLDILRKQWPESHGLLKGALGLYQLHSATFDTGVLENREILEAFAQLRAEGVTLGVSVSGVDQRELIERALEIEVDGQRLFESVQATFNVFEQDCAGILEQAHVAGVGVIVKEALANGRLTQRNNIPTDSEGVSALMEKAAEAGVSIDAFSLAFVAQKSWVDTALSGAATPDQLSSNLKALQIPAFSEGTQLFLEGMRQQSQQYWQTRKQLAWN